MQRKWPIKIAITGPESSGKTSLSTALATRLGAPLVPEYARLYLERFGPTYTTEDVLHIAHGQAALELAAAARAEQTVVVDTSIEVIYIWWGYRFGAPPPWLERLLRRHLADYYLLCRPDLPWHPDPLRENPHDREVLFERYCRLLKQLARPYGIVHGTGQARLHHAWTHLRRAGFVRE